MLSLDLTVMCTSELPLCHLCYVQWWHIISKWPAWAVSFQIPHHFLFSFCKLNHKVTFGVLGHDQVKGLQDFAQTVLNADKPDRHLYRRYSQLPPESATEVNWGVRGRKLLWGHYAMCFRKVVPARRPTTEWLLATLHRGNLTEAIILTLWMSFFQWY